MLECSSKRLNELLRETVVSNYYFCTPLYRLEQERRRQEEMEKQLQKQREIEREKELERQKALEQRENARR
jgi:DNA gyrase/topoisomerase IV subunit B